MIKDEYVVENYLEFIKQAKSLCSLAELKSSSFHNWWICSIQKMSFILFSAELLFNREGNNTMFSNIKRVIDFVSLEIGCSHMQL